ncbi:MAG: sigma-54-dependent Fis family transcriptional regulator [Deltaproteobacteria bacterium]|nr:sigma-54-dependent Fis family transcriptional regulator [Deltaproteobacteria bacterium]
MIMEDILKIIFSCSSKMSQIEAIINEISKTDVTVLIKGESGTGKELLAKAIHFHSNRKERPFVKVNCGAIPKGLLESELFGFERGAFTGAHMRKPGKFELANGGTILLNDIEDTDISTQAKLLQVLQDGLFSRLGGEGDVKVDSRVIATTKDHLEQLMMDGRFREDLFFRINVINLTVPPLRDRREQIHPLSQYFLNVYNKKYRKEVSSLSSKLIKAFKDYRWPGNIRELENMIKRIVIFGEEDAVIQHFSGKKSDLGKSFKLMEDLISPPPNERKFLNLKEVGKKAAEIAEKNIIQATLQETQWNRKTAAKLLRVSYKALLYKIDKYQLNRVRFPYKSEAEAR